MEHVPFMHDLPIKSGGVQSVSFTSQTTGLTSWFPE